MQYAGFDSDSGCRHAPRCEPISALTKDLQREGRVTLPARRVARAPSPPPALQRDGTARRTSLRTDRLQPDRLEYSTMGGTAGPAKRKGSAVGAADEGRVGRPSQPVAAGDRKRGPASAGVEAEDERRRPSQPVGSGSRKRGAEVAGVEVTEVRRPPGQPQGAGSSAFHEHLDDPMYDVMS